MGLLARLGKRIASPFVDAFAPRMTDYPLTETHGVGGTEMNAGRPRSNETNAEMASPRRRYARFGEIKRNEPIAGASVLLTHRILRSVTWRCSAPLELEDEALRGEAEEKAKIANLILRDMTTPFSTVMARMGSFVYDGAALAEWTAKRRDDGSMGFKDIETRPMFTIDQWVTDEGGTVLGVIQRSPARPGDVFEGTWIPRSRLLYAVHDVLTDAPDGVGLFRHLVDPARRRKVYLDIEEQGVENDIRGVLLGKAPLGALSDMVGTKKRKGSDEVWSEEEARAQLAGLESFLDGHRRDPNLSLTIDSGTYLDAAGNPTGTPLYGIEMIQGEGGPYQELQAGLSRDELAMARVLGTEFMMLGGTDVGSFALMSEKVALYKGQIDSMLLELAHVGRRDVLTVLWLMNGWDLRTLPDLTYEAPTLRSVAESADLLVKLSQAGLDDEDPAIDILRARMGLPPAPVSDGGDSLLDVDDPDEEGLDIDPDGTPDPNPDTDEGNGDDYDRDPGRASASDRGGRGDDEDRAPAAKAATLAKLEAAMAEFRKVRRARIDGLARAGVIPRRR